MLVNSGASLELPVLVYISGVSLAAGARLAAGTSLTEGASLAAGATVLLPVLVYSCRC